MSPLPLPGGCLSGYKEREFFGNGSFWFLSWVLCPLVWDIFGLGYVAPLSRLCRSPRSSVFGSLLILRTPWVLFQEIESFPPSCLWDGWENEGKFLQISRNFCPIVGSDIWTYLDILDRHSCLGLKSWCTIVISPQVANLAWWIVFFCWMLTLGSTSWLIAMKWSSLTAELMSLTAEPQHRNCSSHFLYFLQNFQKLLNMQVASRDRKGCRWFWKHWCFTGLELSLK